MEPLENHHTHAFSRHIERLDRWIATLDALDRRFSWYRLAALLGGGLATALAFSLGPAALGWVVALLAAGVFLGVVAAHRRLDARRARFRTARAWIAAQQARLRLDWAAIPPPAASPPPGLDAHPFAPDLNLAGERSLHRLVDTSASVGGSARLLDWLLSREPDPPEIARRQALAQELANRPGFRSRLAQLGSAPPGGAPFNGEALLAWLESQSAQRSLLPYLLLLYALAALNLALLALNLLGRLPPVWIATYAIYGWLLIFKYRAYAELFDQAYTLAQALERFRAVLTHLERYPYPKASQLLKLCEPFWSPERPPSRTLRKINWIASGASLQNNQFLSVLLNALLPWDLTFAYLLERARQEVQARLPLWLERWYELEALASLGNLAYLNPEYAFPALLPVGNPGPVFAARGLGHPLIPPQSRVCNDFAFQSLGECALITGSNMSGKSTFLRTLGVNLALVFAGGPAAAAALSTQPLRLFTCIQVTDSLSDGISYFYAEVRRLKALLDALQAPPEQEPWPLCYLIDEIFRGTNNRERATGSRAYVRALAGGRGVGAISTHDLDLVTLAESIPGLRNYHFREDVQDGRMRFDYRLRPGPSPTTNALQIMALEGLPVESGG